MIGKTLFSIKSRLLGLAFNPSKLYLTLALMGVIGFAAATPPFQGPDEEAHYIRAQYIAQGYLIPTDVASSNAKLPSSIEDVTHITFYEDDLRGRTNFTYELYRSKEAFKIPFHSGEFYKPQMIDYGPVPYLPAVPGIVVSNLIGVSPLASLYVARILLGLASILLFYFAIRIIPQKKYLLVVIGLLPMMLFQQAMVTVDGTTYGMLALFLAYTLYLYNRQIVTKWHWIKLGVICIAITLAKPLVFLFLPLILLLINKKHAFKWIFSIGVICVLALAVWMLALNGKTEVVTASGMPDTADTTGQTKLLASEPLRGIRVMWNSYMTTYGDDEVRGVVGVFGAADTAYPLWMTYIYVTIMGVVSILHIRGEKHLHIGKRWKTLAVILCAVYFVLVNVALYVSYTPVNFDIVYGVQGRYFLPLLIVLSTIVAARGVTLTAKDSNKAVYWVSGSVCLMVALAIFITVQRYYLYTP